MVRFFCFPCLIFILSFHNVLAGEIKDQTHCDLVGPNEKVLKNLSSYTECHTECAKSQDCQGYVFVSHWNRCFLKSEVKRLAKVNLISGLPGLKAKMDQDHSGKDIKQESAINAEECQQKCKKFGACAAYTYIKGYQTCWLKKKPGSFRPKVFYCGRKS
ncbi:MAG: hypothetical protein HRU09_10750 [Oligoflexales bacterium]|nr:hypothetical protein [Oligoflexales bacterium]